ncbi:MAG: rRNA maturation RNase YbeY [Bacteroidia bacterium]|nr:rRNA maturation RNase YbeY [Bacteroidia bacterium]NNF31497.1 rRNA maturation RNase YbeY [Flavobacteriaceae bacterium]MBT8275572.1 rRNA maturation RNase YbeY [Bacteroidia bacterium]NNJ82762.1 rRNA maturation RNase YbeY [Flavobacteriaceae bacterium]NNK54076.1 rRNA maturation RNase YbeY [Flavobacteriaceae bacterium]
MVNFCSENEFILDQEAEVSDWIRGTIMSEGYKLGEITFVFCDDSYLLEINKEFLQHDTYTDIISFDYSLGKEVHGEIYISIERVQENAVEFETQFRDELHRVIIHGVLHLCGYNDKETNDKVLMRTRENECLLARNFL